ncbi:MAG: hypothetical protein KIT25_03110 [Enhydrobacter sp.]|nr:MAG: hypothetical protein KIT25_03110 [Enhydrobacter sp.]
MEQDERARDERARDERARIERLNREAALEKAPDDPQAVTPRDTRPLIALVVGALAVTVVVLGWMWMANPSYDGTGPRPVAERDDAPSPTAHQ